MALRNTPSPKQEEQVPKHPRLPELSPFQAGRKHPPATVFPNYIYGDIDGIGIVLSTSEEVDEDGAPVRATTHFVGIECLHWAPDARETGDCRFGCIGRAA